MSNKKIETKHSPNLAVLTLMAQLKVWSLIMVSSFYKSK